MVKNNGIGLPGTTVCGPVDPIVIGRIARPVGVKGEAKTVSTSGSPDIILNKSRIVLRFQDQYRSLRVSRSQLTGKWIRLKFVGINTPEEAAVLNGAEIVIPAADRPESDEHEYYVDDLVGCTVIADDGEEIGFLQEVWHQGHHDIWVIDGLGGEVLIPAVKEFILSVDLEKHMITIKRVEGLLD
ncbi:MAG: 16S rRNA processing protein RimM [Calditrichaeota bacterium]|nr:16S rRNA processing protein RimM [Calditrichota bacterium]